MRFLVKKISSKDGQLLVESIVALSVLTVGFLGMFSLLSRSLGLTRVVSDEYTGTYLAEEGIEIVKNIISSNVISGLPWNNGFSDGSYEVDYTSRSLSPYSDRFLYFDPSSHLYGYSGSKKTMFKRRVEIDMISDSEIKVNSIVSWTTRGGGNYSVNLEDRFFNWYQ